MNILLWILLATFIDSLVALAGIFTLGMKEKTLNKIIFVLVGFSAGTLLAGGMLHLLAESLETLSSFSSFIILIVGFSVFFLMEKFLHWHHCHEGGNCEVHPYTVLILLGDGLHNFIDGIVIGVSFLVNTEFGIITTLMIISHEIPQELGDFGVLLYGGMKKRKAIIYNFISQATCIIGGLMAFFIKPDFVPFVLPFAAGGFIYISASDLIPELHKEVSVKKSVFSFIFFIFGIAFMTLVKILFGG